MPHSGQTFATVPIDNIEPWPDNPNQGDIGAIVSLIQENGFYGTIVVQKSSNRICAGNHRWKAMKIIGAEEVPVMIVDCDDLTARKILLADNRASELATRDAQMLVDHLVELASMDELVGTGYDGDDIDQLLQDLDTEFVPEPPGGSDDDPLAIKIVFDTKEQLREWQGLLRWLSENTIGDSTGERLLEWVSPHWPGV